MGCSRFSVVSTYGNWITVKPVEDAMMLDIQALLKKKKAGNYPTCWMKINIRQLLRWQLNTIQVQVELFRSTQFSSYCWIWHYIKDVPLIYLCWPSFVSIYAYTGPGIIVTGSWISGKELTGLMNHNSPFITSMVVSGYSVFQTNLAPSVFSR